MNLFEKVQEVVQVKTQVKEYSEDIKKIHSEFLNASDVILQETKVILDSLNIKDRDKVQRLKNLGFNQAKQVKEINELIKQELISKKVSEKIQYYSQNYPFNKFITDEKIKEICTKYNLVFGDASLYTGFIPEKNLKEIENFKIKEVDRPLGYLDKGTGNISKDDFTDYGYDYCIKRNNSAFIVTALNELDVYAPNSIFKKECRQRFSTQSYVKFIPSTDNNFKIVCPLKDINMKDQQKINHIISEVPKDPIVLYPVQEGYLILTMWADETFDPSTEPDLFNEKNN